MKPKAHTEQQRAQDYKAKIHELDRRIEEVELSRLSWKKWAEETDNKNIRLQTELSTLREKLNVANIELDFMKKKYERLHEATWSYMTDTDPAPEKYEQVMKLLTGE